MTAVRSSSGRPSLATTLTADVLAGLTLALIIASVVIGALASHLSFSGASTLAIAFTFFATGYLVARRQPANLIGWLLLVTGLSAGFTTAVGLYAFLDYRTYSGTLPLGPAVLFLDNATWPVSLLVGMASVLLFPDGRLTAPWLRVLRAYAAVSALIVVSQAIPAAVIVNLRLAEVRRVEQGATLPPGGPLVHLLASGLPVLAAVPFWLAFIVRQVIAYRQASGDVRQQYKWFTAGAAVTGLSLVVMTISDSATPQSPLESALSTIAIYATAIAFPLGMGVAILRYRLYAIDRIISRTLSYAIVTGLLAGLYAGLVLLATQALPVSLSTPQAVAIATLAAAALFNPLRRRVQRIVDRQFNRARYDADRTIAAFAARLQGAPDLDLVRDDLLGVIHQVLEPSHTSLWLKEATAPAGPGTTDG